MGSHERMAGMAPTYLFALLLLVAGQGEERTCRLVVVDSAGAELGKAHILVHSDGASRERPDRLLDADAHGKLTLSLPEGNYDVCVMSTAFTPTCRKVVLRGRDLSVRFKLSVSPEVMEQVGDTFK